MAIDPHHFDPAPIDSYEMPPPPETCKVCGRDRRMCELIYKPREIVVDEGQG